MAGRDRLRHGFGKLLITTAVPTTRPQRAGTGAVFDRLVHPTDRSLPSITAEGADPEDDAEAAVLATVRPGVG